MKKLLSVIISFVLVAVMLVPAAALDVDEVNDYPIVLVPGYSSSTLVMTDDNGNVSKVWGLDFDAIAQLAQDNIDKLLIGAGKMTQQDYEYLGRFLGQEFQNVLEYMKCNPDGSSKYNITTRLENTAEACCWSNMSDGSMAEYDIMSLVAEHVSKDKIFEFNCDFRMGVEENANRLNELILDVMKTTGYDKVNIIAVSHGGQLTGAYLSLFGTQGHVNNCVMCVPAMGGAVLAYDALSQNVVFDENTLVQFLEHGFMLETDYHWITTAQSLGFLDDLLAEVVPYVWDIISCWGSMLDFVPLEYFEDIVAMLDPVENAALIEQTTRFHYEIMANYGTNLKAAQAAGANITILTGCGIPSVSGLQENSDAIIRTADTSGATCAPYGKRFSDGYQCLGTGCSDPSHNHLSPSMEIDASTCWLPDNTWFVDGLYHGMELYDEYTISLTIHQLVSAEPLADVYADKDYPQFHATTNPSSGVHAMFNVSAEGYVSSADTELIITNITKETTMDIYDVVIQGMDVDTENFIVKTLKPGESTTLKIIGDVPEVSLTRAAVTVYYYAYGSATPIGMRTLDFTVMNGEPVSYDASKPYSDVDTPVYTADATECEKNSAYSSLITAFKLLVCKLKNLFNDIRKFFSEF